MSIRIVFISMRFPVRNCLGVLRGVFLVASERPLREGKVRRGGLGERPKGERPPDVVPVVGSHSGERLPDLVIQLPMAVETIVRIAAACPDGSVVKRMSERQMGVYFVSDKGDE
jgi:hypothetical protein